MDDGPVAARNVDVGIVPTVHRARGAPRIFGGAAAATALGLFACFLIAVNRDARNVGAVLLALLFLGSGGLLLVYWWRERSTVVEIGTQRVAVRRAGVEQACAWSEVRAVEASFVRSAGPLGLGKIEKVYRSLTLIDGAGRRLRIPDNVERFAEIVALFRARGLIRT